MKKSIILSAFAAAVLACTPAAENSISVVPYPNEVNIKSGSFDAAGADFHYSSEMDEASVNLVEAFAGQLSKVTGISSTADSGSSSTGFVFDLNQNLGEEEYSIKVSRKAVKIEAAALRGFN